MIHLFIIEASIEIVPDELWGERCVVKDAKRRRRRPSNVLLNISRHYAAMKRHGMLQRRGRPDITHLALVTALDSPLNRMGHLRVFVHTLNGEVIYINPEARLPRNQGRFEGLMAKLLVEGRVPGEPPSLLEVLESDLSTLVEALKLDRVIGLSRIGSPIDLDEYLHDLVGDEVCFMVGGFQEGHFSPEVSSLADETFSISPFPLSSHLVVCKVLSAVEKNLLKGGIRGENP